MKQTLKVYFIVYIILLGIIGVSLGIMMSIIEDRNTLEIPTLEIYTPNNIYYIDELRVTNENNNIVLTFENTTQLYNYIAEITANDTQDCN